MAVSASACAMAPAWRAFADSICASRSASAVPAVASRLTSAVRRSQRLEVSVAVGDPRDLEHVDLHVEAATVAGLGDQR
jgi:hypothetical protein